MKNAKPVTWTCRARFSSFLIFGSPVKLGQLQDPARTLVTWSPVSILVGEKQVMVFISETLRKTQAPVLCFDVSTARVVVREAGILL